MFSRFPAFLFSCFPAFLFSCCTIQSFSQSKNDSALIEGINWLQSKLNGYEIERYKSGEIYKEYETKISYDYTENNFIYEFDRKSLNAGDHYRYVFPVEYIDAANIRIEKTNCCKNDPVYYETNEAVVFIPSQNNKPVIGLFLIDKDGRSFELEYKRNLLTMFIPTPAMQRTENLADKVALVLKMITRLREKEGYR